jgi:hypothetical protein
MPSRWPWLSPFPLEEQISPGYMRVWGEFFPGQLTSKPAAPTPLAGSTIPVGAAGKAPMCPVTAHAGFYEFIVAIALAAEA